MSGVLYVVATPLGNLEDLSPRARRTLESVNLIACEDTRRTARLLNRFGIETPMLSCHRFNEKARLQPVLDRLLRGETVALVSDAGTPGLADPGALLVEAAITAGIRVSPIPGASAAATLLSASGLAADRFVFEGYLPHRSGERRRLLRELRDEQRPVVVLETPHRIRDTLVDIAEVMGSRELVLGRELTKLHETIGHGSAAELLESLDAEPRGEFTLVLAPPRDGAEEVADAEARSIRAVWRETLAASDGDQRKALRRAARELGLRRAELYRRLAELEELSDES